jgi:hypothetical protein
VVPVLGGGTAMGPVPSGWVTAEAEKSWDWGMVALAVLGLHHLSWEVAPTER